MARQSAVPPDQIAHIGVYTTESIKTYAQACADKERRSLSKWIENLIVEEMTRSKPAAVTKTSRSRRA